MKRFLTIFVMMAVALVPYGTAHAYPIKDKRLTHNALYRTGPLDTTECTERPVRPRDLKLVKAYLHGLLDCLDTTWSAQLKKAGHPFRKPALKLVTKAPRRFCGQKWEKGDNSYYCDSSRTILILLDKNVLADPGDLFLFGLLADRYGQHVQNLAGIWRAYLDHEYRTKSEAREQSRRYELQSTCFGTAFLKSTWDSLDRSAKDWRLLLRYIKGWKDPQVGSAASLSHWAGRGFATGDPAACNTWTAPSRRVA